MGTNQIKALVFDFGGVLTNPVWESFAAFCLEEGLDPGSVKKLFRDDPGALADLRRLETAQMSEDDFEASFSKRLGLDSGEGLIERLFAGMKPQEEMIGAVRAARDGGMRTALLSNSWSVEHYDRRMLDRLFDVLVISGEVGLHKPQPQIYELTADRLGVATAECAFVDDLRENCEGAEAVGMTAIRHRDPAATISELEELTALRLGAEGD